jgi:hypothetical protein
MKSLIYTLAGAAAVLALAASPIAAQGRERPAGAAGGGSAAAGGGNSGGSGGGMSAGTGNSGGSVAVPRGSSGGGSSPTSSSGSSSSGAAWRTNPVNGNSSYVRDMYGSPGDRSVPRGARPNPGGPGVGQATLRPNTVPNQGHSGSLNWYVPYNPYSLFGFGAYGLGYLYYDPFWWSYGGTPYGYGYSGSPYGDYGYPGYGGYGQGGYGQGGYGYYGDDRVGRGGLKLKVEPKDAEVYVDGYFMGIVDDFDGAFQRMELEAGAHRVEIRAPGFQTISFDVRVEANNTITYRGALLALSKR